MGKLKRAMPCKCQSWKILAVVCIDKFCQHWSHTGLECYIYCNWWCQWAQNVTNRIKMTSWEHYNIQFYDMILHWALHFMHLISLSRFEVFKFISLFVPRNLCTFRKMGESCTSDILYSSEQIVFTWQFGMAYINYTFVIWESFHSRSLATFLLNICLLLIM